MPKSAVAHKTAAEALSEAVPPFDPTRTHDAWSGYTDSRVVGFENGQPIDSNGKRLPGRVPVLFVLQNGYVYNKAGEHIPWDKVPKDPRQIFRKRMRHQPYPGVTHKARVWRCPGEGCIFSTPVRRFYEKHCLDGHGWNEDQLARLEAKAEGRELPRERPAFDLGDFENPDEVAWFFAGIDAPEEPTAEEMLDME